MPKHKGKQEKNSCNSEWLTLCFQRETRKEQLQQWIAYTLFSRGNKRRTAATVTGLHCFQEETRKEQLPVTGLHSVFKGKQEKNSCNSDWLTLWQTVKGKSSDQGIAWQPSVCHFMKTSWDTLPPDHIYHTHSVLSPSMGLSKKARHSSCSPTTQHIYQTLHHTHTPS